MDTFGFQPSELLFWGLAAVVLLPWRLQVSIGAFLLISHVDLSGPDFHSVGSLGWQNVVKSVVLPAWLAIRGWFALGPQHSVRSRVVRNLVSSPPALLWVGFVAYAALGILASPFPLAGVKLVGALVGHTLVFLALLFGWLSGRLSHLTVAVVAAGVLVIGGYQTFVLGSPFTVAGESRFLRFTTFSSPQSFIQGFVPLAGVLLWSPRWGLAGKMSAIAAILGGALASGSRVGFLGAAACVAVWFVRRLELRRLGLLLILAIGAGALVVSETGRRELLGSRVGELRNLAERGASGISNVPTFRWRRDMYGCYMEGMRRKSDAIILFGSGTSSTGLAALACEPSYETMTFSPNRVAHCEFIRVAWEWGLFGLLLFISLLMMLCWFGLKAFVRAGQMPRESNWHFGALASSLPIALLAIAFENFLQASGAPGAVGLIFVVSQAVAASLRRTLE